MFKLIVNGKNGHEESDFTTQVEAEAHFEYYKSNGYWGDEEQVINHAEISAIEARGAILAENGDIVSPAIVGTPVIPAWIEIVPSTFTYEIIEIIENTILKEIDNLESLITPRRIREAMVSGDYSFIENINLQISELRVNL